MLNLYKNALRVVYFTVLPFTKGVIMIRQTKLYKSLWAHVRWFQSRVLVCISMTQGWQLRQLPGNAPAVTTIVLVTRWIIRQDIMTNWLHCTCFKAIKADWLEHIWRYLYGNEWHCFLVDWWINFMKICWNSSKLLIWDSNIPKCNFEEKYW